MCWLEGEQKVRCLVPMEEMMANLKVALKKLETKHPDSRAAKILAKAVRQAKSLMN